MLRLQNLDSSSKIWVQLQGIHQIQRGTLLNVNNQLITPIPRHFYGFFDLSKVNEYEMVLSCQCKISVFFLISGRK